MSILRKLEAPDDYVYVCCETYGKVVYLGKNDSEDRWVLMKETNIAESMSELELKAKAYDILMGEEM